MSSATAVGPGTPASRMKNQISNKVKKARSARLLALSENMEREFAAGLRGELAPVLWEQVSGATPEGFINLGYSDNFMRVRAIHPRDLSNVIARVELGAYTDGAIHGTVREIAPERSSPAKPIPEAFAEGSANDLVAPL